MSKYLQTYQILIFAITILCTPLFASASTFSFPEYVTYNDGQNFDYQEAKQLNYAELNGFPQNYFFTVSSSTGTTVDFLISIPDTPEANRRIGAIIVKQLKRGGVEEVVRLNAAEASWESYRDPLSNDSYLRGAVYNAHLGAGNYLLEVNSPENSGKYVLQIGEPSGLTLSGIAEEYTRVYLVKKFLGKPAVTVVFSPLYYIPLMLILLGMFGIYGVIKGWFTIRRSFQTDASK